MRQLILGFLLILGTGLAPNETYVASTESPMVVRSFFGVPTHIDSDKATWHLTLSGSGESGTFNLDGQWGFHVDNATWEIRGTLNDVKGTWRKDHQLKNYTVATVITLTRDDGKGEPLSLLRLDENLLQILDREGRPAKGGGGWSNTLNRLEPTRSTGIFFGWGGDAVSRIDRQRGYFELQGRSPSALIANELSIERPTDQLTMKPWPKIKWRIRFNIDSSTGEPTTFEMTHVLNRQKVSTGPWSIEKGLGRNASAIVYVLKNVTSNQTLSLLKVSEDVFLILSKNGSPFVGDTEFSYTLNRVE